MLRSIKAIGKGGLTALLCPVLLAGCVSTNPATGDKQLSFVSEKAEYEIGHEIYGEIVKDGGGFYKESPQLTAYLNEHLMDIVKVSERADKPFKMTLLDSPIFNAAAVPGYIFVYRGMLPFLHNEAQLVSIMGHEVGHITARHTARQQTTQTIAAIGQALLGAYLTYEGGGQPLGDEIMQVTDVASQYLFAGYSRSHETEADELAVRYLGRLNYDTYAASEAFRAMGTYSRFTKAIYKKAGKTIPDSIFHRLLSTHPEDMDRVNHTLEQAAAKGNRKYLVHRDRYLDAIDGLAFGPKIKDYGVIKNGSFIHPKYRFRFDIPANYLMPLTEGLPLAINEKHAAIIDYAVKKVPEDEDAEESLIYTYKKIYNVNPIQLGNILGYTGILDGEDEEKGIKVRSRIIGFKSPMGVKDEKEGNKKYFYSLVLIAPTKSFNSVDQEFMQMAKNVKLLTKEEADKTEPLRVHIYTTEKGDTQASVAAKMGFSSNKQEWLRLLNNLKPTDKLLPDMRLKVIY